MEENNEKTNQEDKNDFSETIKHMLKSIDVTRVMELISIFIQNKGIERDKINIEKTKEVNRFEIIRLRFYVSFVAFIVLVICFLAYHKLIGDTITASLISLIIGYSIGNAQRPHN